MNPLYDNSNQLPYRILAMDLDDTLVNDQKHILPSSYNALMEAQRRGLTLVIASGRPTYGCMKIAEELELKKYGGYLLSYNGGKITDLMTGHVLGRRTISIDNVKRINDFIKPLPVTIITYTHDMIITEHPEDKYVQKESWTANNMPVCGVSDFMSAVVREPFKCAILGDAEELQAVNKKLKHEFGQELNFLFSSDCFLEVVPANVDKGHALDFLLKDQGLDRQDCIAVGDNYNDLRMIQLAGMGVAMANATEAVKRVADYVTKSNNEDGIQHLLYKHILHPESYDSSVNADFINAITPNTLMQALGIKCTILNEGYVEATMPVDRHTRQPMGILHGGASLALAETVAGYGSVVLLKSNEIQVGMQVSGNHLHSAHEGETVRAIGKIIHQGRSTHVWNVDVVNESGDIICSARVVNSILKKR